MHSRLALPSLALMLWSLLIPASLVHERCSPVGGASQSSESEAVGKIDTISETSLGSSASGILLHHGAADASQARLVANYGKLPLSFEVNEGQADAPVKFVSRGPGYSLFLTGTEAVIALKKSSPQTPDARKPRGLPNPHPHVAKSEQQTESKIVHMQLAGANPSPRVVGMDELPGKANYFIGNDPAKWRTNVPTYAKVKYENVYPGVDLVYYGNQGQLEYDFVVAPGADPSVIQLGFNKPEKLRINGEGELLLGAEDHAVRFQKPVVYQEIGGEKKPVNGKYVLAAHHQVTFGLDTYDASLPLVIDPVFTYSTYLGGNSYEQGNGIAIDSLGNAYVTGYTGSPNFPMANALQPTCQPSCPGSADAFITKINPTGSAMVYSTYLGGNANDLGNAIAVDSSGNAYVTGYTQSTNFPTLNPLQAAFGGGSDAFVAKLDPTGSTLLYSTYLGGSNLDVGNGIAVDSSGNAYVTGTTSSLNFPTMNALRAACAFTCPGNSDAFISKVNSTGSALVYSTYLGGNDIDVGNAIAVDSSGNAYVTGYTGSLDFPTVNALQPTEGSGWDTFISKVNSTGSALVYSTYLGGVGNDYAYAIAVDSSGNAYVTGTTSSINFPTVNAVQSTYGAGASSDGFVAKINPTGSALAYSTYLGNPGANFTQTNAGIGVDSSGNAYVTGSVYIFTDRGSSIGFVTELSASGTTIVYSTDFGDSNFAGTAIAVDAFGDAYVTGWTTGNLPTVNALQPSYAGGTDAFVTQILSAGMISGITANNFQATKDFGQVLYGTAGSPQVIGFTNTGNSNLEMTGSFDWRAKSK